MTRSSAALREAEPRLKRRPVTREPCDSESSSCSKLSVDRLQCTLEMPLQVVVPNFLKESYEDDGTQNDPAVIPDVAGIVASYSVWRDTSATGTSFRV